MAVITSNGTRIRTSVSRRGFFRAGRYLDLRGLPATSSGLARPWPGRRGRRRLC